MTHTGDSFGFPATGKKAVLGGASIIHVRDGKILAGWNFMDMTQMLQQLQAK
jgi:predicted ester cyclase